MPSLSICPRNEAHPSTTGRPHRQGRGLARWLPGALALALLLPTGPAQEPWVFDPGFQRTPLRVTSEALYGIKVLSSGKILAHTINGQFVTGANGQRVGTLVRFDPATGAIDPTWNPDPTLTSAGFNGLTEGPGGKIYYATAVIGELAQQPGDPALNRVIRLHPDGSRDLSFQSPVFGYAARFLGVQPDGKVIVCSGAVNVRGTPAADSIVVTVRLNTDGSLDPTFQSPNFQANASDPPASVVSGNYIDLGVFAPPAFDPISGKIYFCGTFRFVNGLARKGIVRCNLDGTVDSGFVPTGLVGGSTSLTARGVLVQADGKVVLGGTNLRTAAGGLTRYNLLRFQTDGTLDPTFTLVPTTTSTGAALVAGYTGPRAIGLLPDGRIQTSDSRILRFQPGGAADPSFTPLNFTSPHTTFGQIAAFNFGSDATLGTFFAHGNSRYVRLNGAAVNGVTKLTPAGAIDTTFTGPTMEAEQFNPQVQVLAGGKLLVHGRFNAYGAAPNTSIARVLADGTLDPTYALGTLPFDEKQADDVALLPDGSAYAMFSCGSFTSVYNPSSLVRLNPSGGIDTSFRLSDDLQARLSINAHDLTDPFRTLLPQIHAAPGGKVHILPSSDPQFTVYAEGSQRMVRANVDGTEDPTAPALGFANGEVLRDFDEQLLAVSTGYFRRIGRTSDGGFLALLSVAPFPSSNSGSPYHFRLCRIRPDGTVDPAFNAPSVTSSTVPILDYPQIFDPVTANTLQPPLGVFSHTAEFPLTVASEAPDGSVYVIGNFRLSGTTVDRLVGRFTPGGSWDPTFAPAAPWAQNLGRPGRPARVTTIAVDPSGKVWLAGRFDTLGGMPAPGVARLQPGGAVDTAFSLNAVTFHDATSDLTGIAFAGRKAYLSGAFRRTSEAPAYALSRIQIGQPEAPAFTSAAPPAQAVVGVPYSHQFTASGLPTPHFTLTEGTLPPGLTLTADGLLSGVPQPAPAFTYPNLKVTTSNSVAPDATQTFSIRLVSTASSYLAAYGLTGANAAPTLDYARDGIANLLKYALGLNPTLAGGAPVVPQIRSYAGSSYLSLTFPRSALATDLTYIVEVTDNLGAVPVVWNELARSSAGNVTTGSGFVGETGSSPTFQVEVRDTVAVPSALPPHRFLQLRVTTP